jgi:hypothetical protein
LNQVAAERGLEGVEWRSFKQRGITLTPTIHEGATRRVRVDKTRQPDAVIQENKRRREERIGIEDDLGDFLRSEGTPLDFGALQQVKNPAPKRIAPVSNENTGFRRLRERIREWARSPRKKRPPRSR